MKMRAFVVVVQLAVLGGLTLPEYQFANAQSVNNAPDAVRDAMITYMQGVGKFFESFYGPQDLKKELFNWQVEVSVQQAIDAIKKIDLSDVSAEGYENSLLAFHKIVNSFFNSMKDYHVDVSFVSTEQSTLPFSVVGAKTPRGKRRYFVVYIEEQARGKIGLEVGDEIIKFDGVSTEEAVQRVHLEDGSNNRLETDMALAAMTLTRRRRARAYKVPQGTVAIQYERKKDGRSVRGDTTLNWNYIPDGVDTLLMENVPDVSRISRIPFICNAHLIYPDYRRELRKNPSGSPIAEHGHTLGARRSFIPDLGEVLWRTPDDDIFDAYMFRDEKGKNVGYVRIGSYSGDSSEKMAARFGEIIQKFNDPSLKAESLVIDQVNNPGGSVFYLYALVSMLTDKIINTPKHEMVLRYADVKEAHELIAKLKDVTTDEEARAALGETAEGYPIDMHFVKRVRESAAFAISEWERCVNGGMFVACRTSASHIFGVDEIHPHPDPTKRFTGPILMIANETCFSGGDFCPATLKDAGRIRLIGTNTAGAGGYIQENEEDGDTILRIANYVVTGSLAHRDRPDGRPIENYGVAPDVVVELKPSDFRNGYREYRGKILRQLKKIMPASSTSDSCINFFVE